MVFDVTMQAIGFTVVPDPNNEYGMIISMGVGMMLPISAGPGQPPIMAPIGQLNFPLAKEDGIALGKQIQETAENLKQKSDLVIANNSNVADFAALQEKLKG